MSASTTSKKQCVTCHKSSGILICEGCHQSFCGKHVVEHRQELANQLDHLMQENDLLRQELDAPSGRQNQLFQKIDKWEKEAIGKIQTAAEKARMTLQGLLDQVRGRLAKIVPDMGETFRASREADDFSELELDRWKKQLKDLSAQLAAPPAVRLVPDKNAPIYPVVLQTIDATGQSSASHSSSSSSRSRLQEKFFEASGLGNIDDDGFRVRQAGHVAEYAFARGQLLYSGGSHVVRFKLEKFQKPYRIFFGCVSDKVALPEQAFRSAISVGWFGSNQVYEHGLCSSNCSKYGYHSDHMENNDVLQLTFDCGNKQLRLLNERSKVTNTLNVNVDKTPYPWRLLVVLFNRGDCVRILAQG